jgi:hypothetical protein
MQEGLLYMADFFFVYFWFLLCMITGLDSLARRDWGFLFVLVFLWGRGSGKGNMMLLLLALISSQ